MCLLIEMTSLLFELFEVGHLSSQARWVLPVPGSPVNTIHIGCWIAEAEHEDEDDDDDEEEDDEDELDDCK